MSPASFNRILSTNELLYGQVTEIISTVEGPPEGYRKYDTTARLTFNRIGNI